MVASFYWAHDQLPVSERFWDLCWRKCRLVEIRHVGISGPDWAEGPPNWILYVSSDSVLNKPAG